MHNKIIKIKNLNYIINNADDAFQDQSTTDNIQNLAAD